MGRGQKEYTPPPRDPSFLGLSPDPEVTEQKSYGVYHFPGKTREKGIHHRSGKKGIHHRASDPEKEKKEGLHGGGVYFFLPWWGLKTTSADNPFKATRARHPESTDITITATTHSRKSTRRQPKGRPEFYHKSENSRRLWLFPGSVRGFSGKSPGKSQEICWKNFPESRNATNSMISGTGKGKPAGNLGSTLPGPCPHLPCGVFFEIDSSSLLEFF